MALVIWIINKNKPMNKYYDKFIWGVVSWLWILLVIWITWVAYWAYVTLSNVSTWDPLTASNYNQLIENVSVLKSTVDWIWSWVIPVWAVMAFNGSSCPSWWTAADWSGDEKNTSWTNTTLDLRGEFIRWLDSGRWVDTGRTLASAQAASRINSINFATIMADNTESPQVWTVTRYSQSWPFTSSSSFEQVRPRNVALLYCVKQ